MLRKGICEVVTWRKLGFQIFGFTNRWSGLKCVGLNGEANFNQTEINMAAVTPPASNADATIAAMQQQAADSAKLQQAVAQFQQDTNNHKAVADAVGKASQVQIR